MVSVVFYALVGGGFIAYGLVDRESETANLTDKNFALGIGALVAVVALLAAF